MWTDRLGLKPGDKYPTFIGAGSDAINDIWSDPKMRISPNEFAGLIYRTPDGMYSYTAPVEQKREGGEVNLKKDCPGGASTNAMYHTHGTDKDPGYEYFSDKDIDTANHFNIPSFVGTPNHVIKLYMPDVPNKGDFYIIAPPNNNPISVPR